MTPNREPRRGGFPTGLDKIIDYYNADDLAETDRAAQSECLASRRAAANRRSRRRPQLERICRTPRLIFHLLEEVVGHHREFEGAVDSRLNQYGDLNPGVVRLLGGDPVPSVSSPPCPGWPVTAAFAASTELPRLYEERSTRCFVGRLGHPRITLLSGDPAEDRTPPRRMQASTEPPASDSRPSRMSRQQRLAAFETDRPPISNDSVSELWANGGAP